MKRLTANYANTNHNFVIQNLPEERRSDEYLPAICIIKNILQRGKPTLITEFLREQLGDFQNQEDFNNTLPLISDTSLVWERIIRGDEKGNYFPAKKFYDELIPKYFGDYEFVKPLIIPECPINEITKVYVDEFANQQVDFYLPQAYLIIEIDGSQHDPQSDKIRDAHTNKYGIKTIRISVRDLEKESDSFLAFINEIKERIDQVRKGRIQTLFKLEDYATAFNNDIDLSDNRYLSTAIIRFQILILELLENDVLSFDKKWDFEILNRDIQGYAELAIEDLSIWFKNIFQLHKINTGLPDFSIKEVKSDKKFSNNSSSVKIDFSLLERYTDVSQLNPDCLFIRNDYFDEYMYFKKGNAANELKFQSYQAYDYFKISTSELVEYDLQFGGADSDEEPLKFLLWNLFLQSQKSLKKDDVEYREGQLSIIANALRRNDTIGLLPTGAGKSVCYQLSAFLQPAISFVVCPIKSLMYDQKSDLGKAAIHRINHMTSEDDGEDKERIQKEFSDGKYFFVFISPERFQIKTFRDYLRKVNSQFHIAYAVIDEVHCLSEWGHDFRTSYLNLSSTIKRFCADFRFLGLTATASVNVLKDIQIEFGIKQENVKTPVDYTRKELEFEIIDDHGDKQNALLDHLINLRDSIGALEVKGEETKSGIIFTPIVNDSRNVLGCYSLAKKLTKNLGAQVNYFSGSIPKINKNEIMDQKSFDQFKKKVQDDFKENRFSLMTATKAFGMGVNKGNIHYTFHYGLPNSMESLYQEGGRAGRDKTKFQDKKAKCFVLFSKSKHTDELDKVWKQTTPFSEIKTIQNTISGDVNTNLFLFSLGQDVLKDEFNAIKKFHETFSKSGAISIEVNGGRIGKSKAQTEKIIYRLSQLGVVSDWTISNFFRGGEFEVDFNHYDDQMVADALLATINKYDKEFSFERINSSGHYVTYRKILNNAPEGYTWLDKCILILLQWAYDEFAYNRRKSLKDIYELCDNYDDSREGKTKFKKSLEAYFQFNEKSYILDHIAENPNDYLRWFEVFYMIEDNEITEEFIDRDQQVQLLQNLNRFLQSYRFNTGLDFISGMLRFLMDDFDNQDGKPRLENAIEQILSYDPIAREYIIGRIITLGKLMRKNTRSELAMTLFKYFNSTDFLLVLSEQWEDNFSIRTIVELAHDRLTKINKQLYGRFKEA